MSHIDMESKVLNKITIKSGEVSSTFTVTNGEPISNVTLYSGHRYGSISRTPNSLNVTSDTIDDIIEVLQDIKLYMKSSGDS